MTRELKPCPFCGGDASVKYHHKSLIGYEARVYCCECGVMGSAKSGAILEDAAEMAIEAWNTRVGSTCRIEDSDLPETSPLPGIPRISVYDGDGRKCAEGYYVFHQNRQLCVFGDKLKPDDCDHLIVADGFADWNMPRGIDAKKIVPDGGWIEVVSDAD